MKLIAKKSFKNPSRQIVLENPIHPDHVHKGVIFIIGAEEGTPFAALTREEKHLVTLLNNADCLGEPTSENILKITAELATEAAAEAREAKALHAVARK
jgi:hypothetical protein